MVRALEERQVRMTRMRADVDEKVRQRVRPEGLALPSAKNQCLAGAAFFVQPAGYQRDHRFRSMNVTDTLQFFLPHPVERYKHSPAAIVRRR